MIRPPYSTRSRDLPTRTQGGVGRGICLHIAAERLLQTCMLITKVSKKKRREAQGQWVRTNVVTPRCQQTFN